MRLSLPWHFEEKSGETFLRGYMQLAFMCLRNFRRNEQAQAEPFLRGPRLLADERLEEVLQALFRYRLSPITHRNGQAEFTAPGNKLNQTTAFPLPHPVAQN